MTHAQHTPVTRRIDLEQAESLLRAMKLMKWSEANIEAQEHRVADCRAALEQIEREWA